MPTPSSDTVVTRHLVTIPERSQWKPRPEASSSRAVSETTTTHSLDTVVTMRKAITTVISLQLQGVPLISRQVLQETGTTHNSDTAETRLTVHCPEQLM